MMKEYARERIILWHSNWSVCARWSVVKYVLSESFLMQIVNCNGYEVLLWLYPKKIVRKRITGCPDQLSRQGFTRCNIRCSYTAYLCLTWTWRIKVGAFVPWEYYAIEWHLLFFKIVKHFKSQLDELGLFHAWMRPSLMSVRGFHFCCYVLFNKFSNAPNHIYI